MPELRSGLLWRLDARKSSEFYAEWERAKARYAERFGRAATVVHCGPGVLDVVLTAGKDQSLPADRTVFVLADQGMQPYDMMLSGEEAA